MRELTVLDAGPGHAGCVSRVPIFARLGPEQQRAVGSYARPVSLAAGEHLHDAGDRVGQLFVVHSGQVKVVRVSATGREHVGRVAGPGDVVGEQGFLTGERPGYRVEAAEPTRLCVFEHADLARLVAAHPAIAVELLRSVTARLDDAERRLALAGADVVARVADYLLGLPAEAGLAGAPAAVRWPMPKKDVAAFLATTPESLSRALGRLEAAGLVRSVGERVLLLDPSGLEERAAR